MTKKVKLFKKLLGGTKNFPFEDFIRIVEAFGFQLARINGSHHIYLNQEINELINIQNVGGQVKPYQIKQFLALIEHYNLRMEEDE